MSLDTPSTSYSGEPWGASVIERGLFDPAYVNELAVYMGWTAVVATMYGLAASKHKTGVPPHANWTFPMLLKLLRFETVVTLQAQGSMLCYCWRWSCRLMPCGTSFLVQDGAPTAALPWWTHCLPPSAQPGFFFHAPLMTQPAASSDSQNSEFRIQLSQSMDHICMRQLTDQPSLLLPAPTSC